MADRATWSALIIVVAVFAVRMTGHHRPPLKAPVINTFSLIAPLGTTAPLFGGRPPGIKSRTPGLQTSSWPAWWPSVSAWRWTTRSSLLARITEYWQAGQDNDEAVARVCNVGLHRHHLAAAIIIAVFLGFCLRR